MRIGHGYDAHRLAAGERLVLGGVTIPHDKGLAAHSDGDVALHAGYTDSGHGLMTATLPTGEVCTGEYTIAGAGRSYGPVPYEDQTRPPDERQSEVDRQNVAGKDLSWAEAYGYGPGTYVQPIGSATLVGERGTVLEIVIYSYYYYHGVHGDGVGRDNHGNWYRVHIGKVPKK